MAAIGVLALLVLSGWPVYVEPQRDPLNRADAIFVLGGAGTYRYESGLEYALEGLAPKVVFSNTIGRESVWLTDLCTNQRYAFQVECFEPNPPTTRGEAKELKAMSEAEGWKSVIVVTYRPHISRARYILQQCFTGDLMMADSGDPLAISSWAWNYVYQTAGYLRAAVQSGC